MPEHMQAMCYQAVNLSVTLEACQRKVWEGDDSPDKVVSDVIIIRKVYVILPVA